MAEIKQNKTFHETLMRGDKYIWGIYLWLIIYSIVETFSASSALISRTAAGNDLVLNHINYLLVGFGAIVLFQHLKLSSIRNWGFFLFALGIFLYLLLPFFGTRHQGAIRDIWGIQPSELIKFGMLSSVCFCLSIKRLKSNPKHQFWWLIGTAAVGIIPVALQNLSTAIILAITVFFLMLLGGVKREYIINLSIVAGITIAIGLSALYGLYRWDQSRLSAGEKVVNLGVLNRAHTWSGRIFGENELNPWEYNLTSKDAQVAYAHMAIANSAASPLGCLPGNSQIKNHLPEAYSDYIFAIIFEETGFIGAGILICLYLTLLIRSYYIARKCDTPYMRLLIMAFALLITLQAVIHMGVCTDAMFVTGQPLPLISRGGWSILITSCCIGTMISISRYVAYQEKIGGNNGKTPSNLQ